eukprot:6134030-Prymnesium_polylepis.1
MPPISNHGPGGLSDAFPRAERRTVFTFGAPEVPDGRVPQAGGAARGRARASLEDWGGSLDQVLAAPRQAPSVRSSAHPRPASPPPDQAEASSAGGGAAGARVRLGARMSVDDFGGSLSDVLGSRSRPRRAAESVNGGQQGANEEGSTAGSSHAGRRQRASEVEWGGSLDDICPRRAADADHHSTRGQPCSGGESSATSAP